LKFQNQK